MPALSQIDRPTDRQHDAGRGDNKIGIDRPFNAGCARESSVRISGKAAMMAVLFSTDREFARHDDHTTGANTVRWLNVPRAQPSIERTKRVTVCGGALIGTNFPAGRYCTNPNGNLAYLSRGG